WVLDLLRRTRVYAWWQNHRALRRAKSRAPARRLKGAAPMAPRWLGSLAGVVVALAFAAACVWGAYRLIRLLALLGTGEWMAILRASGSTLLRTSAAVVLGSLWTIPVGIYIGTHPRASEVLQPIVQIAASFPAPMLFPIVLLLLGKAGVSLSVGAVVLMMLGT